MNFPDIQKSTPAEYQYYREERSEKLDIVEANLYVAMFCSHSMREVMKCGVKVHNIKDDKNSKEDRYVVDLEAPREDYKWPIIFIVNNLMNGYLSGGGRIKLNRDFMTEGFLRQPGQDHDLCLNFHSDSKQLESSESSVGSKTLIMT